MKKVILYVASIAAMICLSNNAYAAKPVKKAVTVSKTTVVKKGAITKTKAVTPVNNCTAKINRKLPPLTKSAKK